MVNLPIKERNAEQGSWQEKVMHDALDGTPFQTDDIVNGLLIIESGTVSLLERVTLAATVMGSNLAHDKVAINDNAPSYNVIPQQLSLISKQVCDSTFDSLNKKMHMVIPKLTIVELDVIRTSCLKSLHNRNSIVNSNTFSLRQIGKSLLTE